jgi:hypothetical protein
MPPLKSELEKCKTLAKYLEHAEIVENAKEIA